MRRPFLLAAATAVLGMTGTACTGMADSAETYTAYVTLYDLDEHAAGGEGTVKITVDGRAVTGGAAGFQTFTKGLTRTVALRAGQRVSIEVVSRETGIEPDCSIVGSSTLGRSKEASATPPRPNPGGGLRTSCDWTRPAD
ncbi:MAG: hypothetical protein GEV11_09725 [Streptosporangiales bacterium]|nr:hypothetical protein [Streptosporangiales bacterium]